MRLISWNVNAQRGLTRLSYRMQWEDDFRAYLKHLEEKKPVILCGDLNVAHREIDLKNHIKDAKIYPEIYGSDHCPVGLEIDI